MSWFSESDPKKEAFLKGDGDESRRLHDEEYVQLEETGGITTQGHEEAHPKAGEYIKSVVYGGLDGIITTFASVAGAAGASFPYSVVLVMGFVNLTADGLAMGVGDFMSSRAENQFVKNERKREEWEFDNYLEGEKRELVEAFAKRGLPIQDARDAVDILARCKNLFVDIMMTSELGLVPDTPNPSPIKNGFITVAAFFVFGIIPLIVYIVAGVVKGLDTEAGFDLPFLFACVFTVGILFGLGAITSKFTNQAFWKSGLFMLVNGGVTAGAAFAIGFLIEMLIDVDGASVH